MQDKNFSDTQAAVSTTTASNLDAKSLAAVSATNTTHRKQNQDLVCIHKKELKQNITTALEESMSADKTTLAINCNLATLINSHPRLVNEVISENSGMFSAVETVQANNLDLKHFPNISSFPRVRSVDCHNNQLTDLTLPTTVYNINCTENPNLQKLEIPGYRPVLKGPGSRSHQLQCTLITKVFCQQIFKALDNNSRLREIGRILQSSRETGDMALHMARGLERAIRWGR